MAPGSFITSYFNKYLALVLYSLTFLLPGQLTTNSYFTKLTFYALKTFCSFWYFQNLIIFCQDFLMKLYFFNGWYISWVIWTQLKGISAEKSTWFSNEGRVRTHCPLSDKLGFPSWKSSYFVNIIRWSSILLKISYIANNFKK